MDLYGIRIVVKAAATGDSESPVAKDLRFLIELVWQEADVKFRTSCLGSSCHTYFGNRNLGDSLRLLLAHTTPASSRTRALVRRSGSSSSCAHTQRVPAMKREAVQLCTASLPFFCLSSSTHSLSTQFHSLKQRSHRNPNHCQLLIIRSLASCRSLRASA